MSAGALCLWELTGGLLMANVDLKLRREKRQEHAVKKGWRTDTDVDSLSTDNRSWELFDQSVPIIDNNEDILPANIVELEEQCEEGLAAIVTWSHIR